MRYYPICTGPCQRDVWTTLYEQKMQLEFISWKISKERIASLTPQIMKAELEDLARRITTFQRRGSQIVPVRTEISIQHEGSGG